MAPRLLQRATAVLVGLALTALTGCAADPPTVSTSGVDLLQIPTSSPEPRDYVAEVDNPWLPLLPGAEWVYDGDDGETTAVTVADRTRVVAGVTTTVVREVVRAADGDLVEESENWFAQDRAGNVWSFGAATRAYDARGRPDTAGSWEAGIDGAEAGIAMLADPRRGDGYEQEYAEGEAEGRATVISLAEDLDVASGSYEDLLLTEDTTPLQPGLVEHRYYARGTGLVHERTGPRGGGELTLVGFTPGAQAR